MGDMQRRLVDEPSLRNATATRLGNYLGALAISVIAISLFACVVHDCFVDDAFIGFQYVHNLLAGHGFTFYPNQIPVEGVSNIGWLLFPRLCRLRLGRL